MDLQPIVPYLQKWPGQKALIAMTRREFRRANYRGLYPIRARELTTDNTNMQLISYLGGQPARM